MVRPLSNDLRERVVAAVQAGETSRAIAARFGVAVSSVVKWSQRQRVTGSVMPGKMAGIASGSWGPSVLSLPSGWRKTQT
jgi:transposase